MSNRTVTILNILILLLLAGGGIGLGLIITRLNPNSSARNLVLFYADLLVVIGSVAHLIGFYCRRMFGLSEFKRAQFFTSLRQGIFLAIAFVSGLILLSFGLFNWINISLLVLALVFLESYFLFK